MDKEPIDEFFTNLYIWGQIDKKEEIEANMAQTNIKAVITAEDRASATLKSFGDNADNVGNKIASKLKGCRGDVNSDRNCGHRICS